MPILIDSNDYIHLGKYLRNSVTVVPSMGFDILLVTNTAEIPIERKKIPSDLLSSITDGRLDREISAMRQASDIQVILLHGKFVYKNDGTLRMRGKSRWTRKGVRNLIRTLKFIEGVYIEWADSLEDLVAVVYEMEEYFNKSTHQSLHTRAGLGAYRQTTPYSERVKYFYQGLPSIKVSRARALHSMFPTPMSLYQADISDISDIHGFSTVSATRIYNFLRGID